MKKVTILSLALAAFGPKSLGTFHLHAIPEDQQGTMAADHTTLKQPESASITSASNALEQLMRLYKSDRLDQVYSAVEELSRMIDSMPEEGRKSFSTFLTQLDATVQGGRRIRLNPVASQPQTLANAQVPLDEMLRVFSGTLDLLAPEERARVLENFDRVIGA